MRSRTFVTSGLCSMALAVAVAGVSEGCADAATTSGGYYDVLLDFDGGSGDAPSLSSDGWASVTTAVSAVSPGTVTTAADRTGGRALRTERFVPGAATPAVVVVRADDSANDVTNPFYRDFSFGAWFTLDALSEGSVDDNGNNLVQRGLSRDVSQYKIQLDDRQPMCRVAGSEGSVSVHADVRVQPDTWYRARCRRLGNEVELRLVTVTTGGDLSVADWTANGPIGSVSWPAGEQPMSIGGKVGPDGEVLDHASDQFNGRIDDVFFRSLS